MALFSPLARKTFPRSYAVCLIPKYLAQSPACLCCIYSEVMEYAERLIRPDILNFEVTMIGAPTIDLPALKLDD